jgi:hypothetical protein
VISGKGRRGLAVAGRQLSPRPPGGSPTARRAAAHGCPGTGRSRFPPLCPDAVHTSRSTPSRSYRVRRSPCERSQPPGRNAALGPSSVKGTPRSFLTASQKGSSGPTLERRSLCGPSGPDAEGQAGSARGEPYNSALIRMIEAKARSCFSYLWHTNTESPLSCSRAFLIEMRDLAG